jgi:4-amino-4-deoxy-L-arabinose transferase-like glycosyltransferase
LSGAVMLAFGLRVVTLDAQSLWRDEVDVLRFAYWPLPEMWHNLVGAQHNGPLYYVIMRGWLTVAGHSQFALRFVSLCAGVLSIPLAWQVARLLTGRRAAGLAALLVAVSPYMVWYAQDAKMYALVGALTLLATFSLWQALITGRWRWWIGFVVAASLALYIHMLSALMIPVYGLALPLSWRRCGRRWLGWALAVGLLTLPYLPLAVWQWPLIRDTYQTGHPFYTFEQLAAALVSLYAWGVASVGHWLALAAWVFLVLAGVSSTPRPDEGSAAASRAYLVLWLLLPAGLIYLVSLRAAVFEPRYLMFAAPAFYVLAARGITGLMRLARPVSGPALAVILAFNVAGLGAQVATPIKSDFRSAAGYVLAHRPNAAPIMFQLPYSRYTFEYYFGTDYVALEGPWTNDNKSEADVARLMQTTLGDAPEVWLVASEGWLWDERNLTRDWLDSHARLIESASFTLVDIYHYRLDGAMPHP